MQGAGPPGGHNPFAPVTHGAYGAYNVNTTAQFADEVVPAVPAGPPPSASFAASHQGAWVAPGAPGAGYGQQQHVALQFTDTTAPQYVAGNIQKQEERQNLVGQQVRSDDFAAGGGPGAGAGPSFTQPLNPQDPAAGGAADGSGAPKEDYSKYPFYNVRRYRGYFDVDTKDVLWRVGNSLIGVFRPNFMEVTHKNPDLYGPFWAATTLIFVTAVVGNFVDYMHFRKEARSAPSAPPPVQARLLLSSDQLSEKQWFTDYTKLATSAAMFYGYIFIVGLLLWGFVKWFKGDLRLVNVFCIYGYCLTIFVPVSITCMVPIDWVRWVLVMSATALSAGFLFMNFRATIYSAAPARAVIALLLIVLAHIGLGLGLKLYFFQY